MARRIFRKPVAVSQKQCWPPSRRPVLGGLLHPVLLVLSVVLAAPLGYFLGSLLGGTFFRGMVNPRIVGASLAALLLASVLFHWTGGTEEQKRRQERVGNAFAPLPSLFSLRRK